MTNTASNNSRKFIDLVINFKHYFDNNDRFMTFFLLYKGNKFAEHDQFYFTNQLTKIYPDFLASLRECNSSEWLKVRSFDYQIDTSIRALFIIFCDDILGYGWDENVHIDDCTGYLYLDDQVLKEISQYWDYNFFTVYGYDEIVRPLSLLSQDLQEEE